MRTSGILMPVFSLPSPYGIGTFGKEAYGFVDFLKKAGQRYWQILPLNPTNYGDSPYQSFSSAAGNPYFIDLDMLQEEGLLQKSEYEHVDFGGDRTSVDYGKLYENRYRVLRIAFARFRQAIPEAFHRFCAKHEDWLPEYALFMALKDANGGVSWRKWDEKLRFRDPETLRQAREDYQEDILFYEFLQYIFFKQWTKLKVYANQNGIKMIGDMPIYVADDSVDVWADPKQFDLDEDLLPKVVAGCPPDAFSADGQLWGSPVYDWERMRKEAQPYAWWRDRVKRAFAMYDVIRIDHFRGFESFYCIPYGEKTARRGSWRKGPGMELIRALQEDYGSALPIIAEDLGFLTPEVKKLLKDSGFPGMKVLQFAFSGDPESDYLPHNYDRNCVVYTGTHDNDTIMGWMNDTAPHEVENAKRYMHFEGSGGFNWAMIRLAMMSVADTAVFMMQDFLGLGKEARINTPSTLGGNWNWRILPGCTNDWLAKIIRDCCMIYGRCVKHTEGKEEQRNGS